MIVSYKLLKEFVDLPEGITPDDVADKLTLRGIEVEKFYFLAAATHLTVGKIIACQKHPESDHLHLLQVDCGRHGVLDIVCGAPNARKGLTVIVALVGAELPAKGVVIKAAKIAGYPSEGMCCSLIELGVSENLLSEEQKNGIEELPNTLAAGADNVLELLGLEDCIFDLNILANRPDLSSVIGIARELSAIYRCPLKPFKSLSIPRTDKISVRSATDKCRAFAMLEVETDGKLKTSPEKLKQYLLSLGYRPISPAVDLGNFMMAVTGQPFHFYDLDKVQSLNNHVQFVVKDNFEGEIVALNGKSVSAVLGDIVVTDGTTPICLAGVMGLDNVAVEPGSRHFGIEAADFSYVQIRHTVKRTGLSSDSSQRFIKKVNDQLTTESLMLLATVYSLIDPSFKVISYSLYDETVKPETAIQFSAERANHRLGGHFSPEEMESIFAALRFKWVGDFVEVPRDRPDIREQADLEEEIFRYSDPEALENDLSKLPITEGKRTPQQAMVKRIREYLISQGLYEVLSYTLVDEKADRSYRIFNGDLNGTRLGNAMTADHEYVRSDLTSSIIKTINYNRDRKKNDFGIFEIADLNFAGQVNSYLAVGLTGLCPEQGILEKRPFDFYDLKGYLEGIFSLVGLQSNRYQIRRSSQEFFHPGRSADVFIGQQKIASLGQIHPGKEKEATYVLEIDITALLNLKTGVTKFSSFSIYPDVERDFAFVVDMDVPADELISTIKRAVGSALKTVDIFDVYNIDSVKKSLAVKVKFSAMDHTFCEGELTEFQNKIIGAVREKTGGILR